MRGGSNWTRNAGHIIRVVKVGLNRKIKLKQRYKGGERVSQVDVWGSTVQAEKMERAKVSVCLAFSENSKEESDRRLEKEESQIIYGPARTF